MRLQECLQLRIKDVDFEQGVIVIRSGKGDKDRRTMLPEAVREELAEHLTGIKVIYEKDRKDNLHGVQLPGALERKYPNAGKEWGWFWFFPSQNVSVDPRTIIVRRHHVYHDVLQRAFKAAVMKAGNNKAGIDPYAEAQFRDASARKRIRYQDDTGTAGALESSDDHDLYTRCNKEYPRRPQSPR